LSSKYFLLPQGLFKSWQLRFSDGNRCIVMPFENWRQIRRRSERIPNMAENQLRAAAAESKAGPAVLDEGQKISFGITNESDKNAAVELQVRLASQRQSLPVEKRAI
jgi:hypothetical protein